MKRARVTTRSEAARARARVSPVSPDALLALLDDADITVGQLLAGSAAVASLTADMVTRKDDSVKLACCDVAAACATLAHSTKHVAYCAKRRLRLTAKCGGADVEMLTVTAKQLRVWGSSAVAKEFSLEGLAAGCALTSLHALAQGLTVAALCPSFGDHLSEFTAGRVVTCDGLRVVSAAGPGLNWFEPHSDNEFSVALAQADGSVPVWLTTGDVTVAVLAAVDPLTPACAASATGTATLRESGVASAVYGGLPEDVRQVALQLSVCGVVVAGTCGDGPWCARVLRRLLADHQCAAAGVHARTLTVADGDKYGLAVSVDEQWLVVGLDSKGELSVYSLPGGDRIRIFGGRGAGPLQFMSLFRLCFAPNGDLVVVDFYNKRLQEVTLEGIFVRFIGVGEFGDGFPCCVALQYDIIAVGCEMGSGPRVVLFNFCTGAVMSRFGELGTDPGQLSRSCTGIRFSPDNSHVIVAEMQARRLSLYTTAGVFVRCVGVGVLGAWGKDVMQSVTGEYVAADPDNHRVCVFSCDGLELVRSWGSEGTGDGQFESPNALAAAGQHLYVMDTGRVQMFE